MPNWYRGFLFKFEIEKEKLCGSSMGYGCRSAQRGGAAAALRPAEASQTAKRVLKRANL